MTVSKTECAPEFTAGPVRQPDVHRGQQLGHGGRDQPRQRRRGGRGRDRDARPRHHRAAQRGPRQRHLHVRVPHGLPVGDVLAAGSGHRQDGDQRPRPGRGQAGHGGRADPAEQAVPGVRRRPAQGPGQRGRRDQDRPRQEGHRPGQDRLAGRPAGLGAGRRVLRQFRRPRPRGRRAAHRLRRGRQRPGVHRPAPARVRPLARPARRRAAVGHQRAGQERGHRPEEPDQRRPGGRPDPAAAAGARDHRGRAPRPPLRHRRRGRQRRLRADLGRHPGRPGGPRRRVRAHQRPGPGPGGDRAERARARSTRRCWRPGPSGGQWQSLTAVSLGQRQHVDAAIGALLETLAVVPDLLEVPPTH